MPENNRKMQTDISELENGQLAEQQLPSDFTLVVLVGGASSHMGREKSDLLLDGQTFLEIQIGKGCQLGAKQILISGYRGTQCGEEIVPDRISGQGPLGGLESCFRRAKTEKCLVLGVDTPLVPVEELQNLLKFAMEKADQPVTMLCHNGKEELLIAVYDARLYKEITDFLESGRSSVYRFLNTVGYSLYHTSTPENYFQNINDPEIYKKVCTECEIADIFTKESVKL